MKHTKTTIFCFVMQIVFMLAVPCVLIWLQYDMSNLGTKYKISITALILFIAVFLIFRKIVLHPLEVKMDTQIAMIETNALSVSDAQSITLMKKRWQRLSLFQLIGNCAVPLICIIVVLLTIKAVEGGAIKLFGCLSLCSVSIAIGIIFKVIEIYQTKTAHEVLNEKNA